MGLLVGLRRTRRPGTSLMPVGLLLTPTGNGPKGVDEFRRVGMFEPELPEMQSYTAEPEYAKEDAFNEYQPSVILTGCGEMGSTAYISKLGAYCFNSEIRDIGKGLSSKHP